jgi:thiol-disulfide isomerase/thioredoxin
LTHTDAVTGVAVVILVLGLSMVAGLLWRRRDGRLREVVPGALPAQGTGSAATAALPPGSAPKGVSVPPDVLAGLGVQPADAPVTLLQFSTAFCQPCRATRRILGDVVRMLPAVRHVEVDAESHLDAVRALGVFRTPTVLVLDRGGRVVTRASGQPRVADVIAAVAPYLPTASGETS